MDTMRAALSQACYYPDRAMRAARAGLALYLGVDENCVLPTAGGAAAITLFPCQPEDARSYPGL